MDKLKEQIDYWKKSAEHNLEKLANMAQLVLSEEGMELLIFLTPKILGKV